MTRTREWLLLNAVECWLHHYSSPPSETVEQYKKLRDEFHDTFMASIQHQGRTYR
jgi:RIO-like serine/threonine protein kinase